jgi:HPt (histidine-containing phosphotransfer) domain-containing protein
MSVHQFIRHQPEHSMSLKPSTVAEINSDVLDMDLLNAFEELQIDDEADLIVELIDLYQADLAPRMAGIRGNAAAGEWVLLRRAAHTLKGSSANLGISKVAATCAEIERMDGDNLPRQAADIIERLQREVDKAGAALAAVRQNRLA